MMKTRMMVVAALMFAGPAFGQQDVVDNQDIKEHATKDKGLPEGWSFKLSLGANTSLNYSSAVVGQVDGETFQFGLQTQGNADLRSGQHEWTNRLSINFAQTKTPQIESWVKSQDEATFRTMWLYKIPSIPWFGPYARARVATSLAPGYLVFSADTILRSDKNANQLLLAQQRVKVTDSFEPLTLRESAGVFMRAVEQDDVGVTFTLGAGAQQVFADGYTVADNPDTANIVELAPVNDSQLIGVEAEMDAAGKLNELVAWSFNVNLLYPFISDPEPSIPVYDGAGNVTGEKALDGIDALQTEINGKLSIKLAEWASLDNVVMVKRVPVVSDDWQVQVGLLLTSAFNLL